MKNYRHVFGRTLIALAVAAAWGAAFADEEQEQARAALKTPDSAASAGVVLSSGSQKDRTIFGQYNGLRYGSSHLLLDLDYVKRNDETGFWTILRGRNLGLETREFGATFQRQGDWRINADYSEIVHHEIRTLNTGMIGAGTTTPTIVRLASPGSGTDTDFSLKRKGLGLSGDKWIFNNLQLEVAFKNEDKDGARMWGRGYDCASYVCASTQNATNTKWAIIPVPEPVAFNTKQIDAKLNFIGERLFLTGGYYGSFFQNANGNVRPSVPNQLNNAIGGGPATLDPAGAGGTSLQNVLQLPMAIYPDNQAHQFYVSGNYRWTPKVRSTFKLSYTHATQNEDYGAMGFTGLPTVSRANLGGVLDTTVLQTGLTARPIDRLSLNANVRYEDKRDKTPIELYNVENTNRWNNSHISHRKLNAKAEGSYLLPANVRATVGVDYDMINRAMPGADVTIGGITGIRSETKETTYRAELRRSISETLTGSVGIARANRTGSDWKAITAAPGIVVGNFYTQDQIFQRTGTFPYNMSDRTRDKVKATADWTPIERLSLQFVGEKGKDTYTPPSQNGLQKGGMTLLSLDAGYTLSEKWKFTAYGSVGEQTMGEADRSNYVADTRNQTTAFGLGVVGNPTGVLQVGGGWTQVRDVTHYSLTPDVATTAANIAQNALGLPDVVYQQRVFNVYGKYALNRQSDIRLDLTHVTSKLEEWSWGYNGVPFLYSDNSTVTINPIQSVTLISARFIYKF